MLGGTDVETPPQDLLYTITSLPADGTLYLGSTPVQVGDQLPGPPALRYVHGAMPDGQGLDSFAFNVTDADGLTSAPVAVALNVIQAVADGAWTLQDGIVRIGGTPDADVIVLYQLCGRLFINCTDTGIATASINEVRVWGRDGIDLLHAACLPIPIGRLGQCSAGVSYQRSLSFLRQIISE